MKRLSALVLVCICMLGVVGCSRMQNNPSTDESKAALIPMVMVNETLYMDTGYDSTIEGRCGVMDGEITSAVDGSERPTEDNQSNFGKGFGYQYGAEEGTIEIYKYQDEKWRIFATEEVREQIQSAHKHDIPQTDSAKKKPFYFSVKRLFFCLTRRTLFSA